MPPFLTLFILLAFPLPLTLSFTSHLQLTSPEEVFEITHPLPSDQLEPYLTQTIIAHSFEIGANESTRLNVPYIPPSDCPCSWSYVALEFSAQCDGQQQYAQVAGLWLGGVELLRTSPAEPTSENGGGIFWRVLKDVTRYSSQFSQDLNLTVALEDINYDFTGVFFVNVTLFFYKENVIVPSIISDTDVNTKLGYHTEKLYDPAADLIIPVSNEGSDGFWFHIDHEYDVKFLNVSIPRNTYKAMLELCLSFHGDDEYWYSNVPNSYVKGNNLTTTRANGSFREVYVTIDGQVVGTEIPFPVIYGGGINPLFWNPIVSIGAFDMPTYDIDLTPLLGLLLDGEAHQFGIGVTDGISYWLVNANLHLWLDASLPEVQAGSSISLNPDVEIEREEEFKSLDGKFEVEVERKIDIVGWVKSSSGNLTTSISREMEFKNKISIKNDGTYKTVKQKVKIEEEMKVTDETGQTLKKVKLKTKFPLYLITSTTPGLTNDSYMVVSNVTNSLKVKFSSDEFSSKVHTKQVCGGWLEYSNGTAIAGEASTKQNYSYNGDGVGCYSRNVEAVNGTLVKDLTADDCVSAI